jgi:hypothetical protein
LPCRGKTTAQAHSSLLDRFIETQHVQHAHAVGLHADPATFGAPPRAALDQFDPEAIAVESAGRRETGDPTPDDQGCLDFGHVSLR